MSRQRILISNDDGVAAPGLLALTSALERADFCNFVVCGPSGERSAQSHCISLGKVLHAFQIEVEGAEEAWAVEGTPADSVMLALTGPVLKNRQVDLVVSGINRGDNFGLHVIYSGTVGAAREAALKDLPALAFSLDNYSARSQEQYAEAAKYSVALIKAVLGILPGPTPSPLAGHVLNINIPGSLRSASYALTDCGSPALAIRGYCLARQGMHCASLAYEELADDPQALREEGHRGHLHAGAVTLRAFANKLVSLRGDPSEGTDSWAVGNGWVAVTPVGLLSDVPLTQDAALWKARPALIDALVKVVTAAAKDVGTLVKGLPENGQVQADG